MSVTRTTPAGVAGYKAYEDTNFVTGESGVIHSVHADLGRAATDGYIINDGSGNFTFAISADGADFGDEVTMKSGESVSLEGLEIAKIRITWVADSAYRILVK